MTATLGYAVSRSSPVRLRVRIDAPDRPPRRHAAGGGRRRDRAARVAPRAHAAGLAGAASRAATGDRSSPACCGPTSSEEDARRSLRQATWLAGPDAGRRGRAARSSPRAAEVGLEPARGRGRRRPSCAPRPPAGDLEAARALRSRPLAARARRGVGDRRARRAARRAVPSCWPRHAAAAEAAGDLDAAVRWARERAAADPLSEVAQTELMRLLTDSGDRAAALQVADALRRRLSDELGVTPSAETRAAIEAVLIDDDRPSQQPAATSQPSSEPRPPPSARPHAPSALPAPLATLAGEPLVGRAARRSSASRPRRNRPPRARRGSSSCGRAGHRQDAARRRGRHAGRGGRRRGAIRPLRRGAARQLPAVRRGARARGGGRRAARRGAARRARRRARRGCCRAWRPTRDAPPAAPDSDPELARYRMFEAVRARARARRAPTGPALLVLDDIQWADAGGLALLAHLVGRLRDERLLVLMTFRDADAGAAPPVRCPGCSPSCAARGRSTRIALEPLDAEAIAELIERRGRPPGRARPPPHRRQRAVRGRDAARARRGRQRGRRPRRGARADRAARRSGWATTRWPSCARRPSPAWSSTCATCARSASWTRTRWSPALDRALEARLIREETGAPGVYQFAHALVADAVYGGMSGARRARLHCRLGESLADARRARGRGRPPPAGRDPGRRRRADADLGGARRRRRAGRAGLRRRRGACSPRAAARRAARARRAGCWPRWATRSTAPAAATRRATRSREAADVRARRAATARRWPRAALGYKGLAVTVTDARPRRGRPARGGARADRRRRPGAARAAAGRAGARELLRRPRARRAGWPPRRSQLARGARDPATLAHTLSAQHLALWDARPRARPARRGHRDGARRPRRRRPRRAAPGAQLAGRSTCSSWARSTGAIAEIDAYEREARELRLARFDVVRAAVAARASRSCAATGTTAEELSRRRARAGRRGGRRQRRRLPPDPALAGRCSSRTASTSVDLEAVETRRARVADRAAARGSAGWRLVYRELGDEDAAQALVRRARGRRLRADAARRELARDVRRRRGRPRGSARPSRRARC